MGKCTPVFITNPNKEYTLKKGDIVMAIGSIPTDKIEEFLKQIKDERPKIKRKDSSRKRLGYISSSKSHSKQS